MSTHPTPSPILVVPAAGKASRALSLSGYGATPKAFTNAGFRAATVIEEITNEAVESGIRELCFVIGRAQDEQAYRAFYNPLEADPDLAEYLRAKKRDAILDELRSRASLAVHFVVQKRPIGFGNAVSLVKTVIDGKDPDRRPDTVAVALSDDMVHAGRPALLQLLDARQRPDEMIVAVMEVPREEARKYGVIVVSEPGRLTGRGSGSKAVFRPDSVIEKPSSPPVSELRDGPRVLAIVGRYILGYRDIEFLAGQEGRVEKEADFTRLFQHHIQDGTLVAVELDGRWVSVGSPLDAQKAALTYALAPSPDGALPTDEDRELLRYAEELLARHRR